MMAVALVGIAVRTVQLQAGGGSRYEALAERQLVHTRTLVASRGSITDRNGQLLAVSVPRATVFADPSLITDPAPVARALAPLLDKPEAELAAAMTVEESEYEPLARQVEPAVERRVRDVVKRRQWFGIGFEPGSARVNPAGSLAGPVVGGMEAKFADELAGRAGYLEAERDPSGREIPATERREVPATPGDDVVLTLDAALQYQAEQELLAEVARSRAHGGMAVIVEVRTGEVLALAQVDGARGTQPARPSLITDRSRLFTDPYEPGSTTKVITAASALESGAITLDTRFSVPSSITVGGAEFPDDEEHGQESWTVREILAESSNVGTIMIADRIGRAALDRSMREFGFAARTSIRFPGETAGLMQSPTNYDPAIMGSMPIGYGSATSAMQTLNVFATVANGGVRVPLRLVRETIDAQGRRHPYGAGPSRRVISAKTAGELNEILRGVVAGGTGVRAAIPGYIVAGKTGTARKPPYEKPYRYMASFAGFAPAESPRLAALVVLDEPRTGIYGGAVAAPVFAKIMEDALRISGIAPTVDPGLAAASR